MVDPTTPATENDEEKNTPSVPTAKLSALVRLASFGKKKPAPFPPESWTTEGVQYGGTAGTETVPFYHTEETLTPTTRDISGEEAITTNDPSQLAIRIRQLIGLLPNNPTPTPEGTPPPAPNLIDERLKSLLASATIMPSVWSILDKMRPGKTEATKDKEEVLQPGKLGMEGGPEGIMMYAPLTPDKDSEPEIASISDKVETPREPNDNDNDTKAPAEKREKKVWVPSTEQISLESTWWGFRIYLPPPVMASLSRVQPVATKQAAIITTALKWTLDKIPVMMAPPPMRPALMVLKRLVPYVGSIGVFISWSWGTITKHDKGKGVVLTASWLLPVALVPSSWPEEAGEQCGASPSESTEAKPAPIPSTPSAPATPAPEEKKEEEPKSTWSRLWKGKEKAT